MSQIRIKLFLMLVFPFVRISARINGRPCRSDFLYFFPYVNCMKIITCIATIQCYLRHLIKSKMKFSSGTYEKLMGLVREESALYEASLPGY